MRPPQPLCDGPPRARAPDCPNQGQLVSPFHWLRALDPAAASTAVQAAGQLKTTDCAPIALLAVGFLVKKSVSLYDIGF